MQIIKRLYNSLIPLLLILTFIVGTSNLRPTDSKQFSPGQAGTAPVEQVIALPSTNDQEPLPQEPEKKESAKVSPPAPSVKPKTSASPQTAQSTTAKRAARTTESSRSQTTSRITSSGAAASTAALVNTGKQYIGVKYVWGGTTPSGFDCSGYVQYVFARHGISLPRIARDQYRTGKAVAFNNLQPADLVFFSLDGDKTADHVGIYLGSGQFIHASSSKGVIVSSFSSYWRPKYLGAKRVL